MLKYVDTLVAFSEVPDEISLCINISNCSHKCAGCHSPWLQKDIGEELTETVLDSLIKENDGITCVCFMGGDCDLPRLHTLGEYVKNHYGLKIAWYTGLDFTVHDISRPLLELFDFIKTGKYIEAFGSLTSRTTNQRFYAKLNKLDASPNRFYDITDRFWG